MEVHWAGCEPTLRVPSPEKTKTKKVQLLKPLTENYPHFQVNKNVHQENTREKACIRSDTFFFFFKGTR